MCENTSGTYYDLSAVGLSRFFLRIFGQQRCILRGWRPTEAFYFCLVTFSGIARRLCRGPVPCIRAAVCSALYPNEGPAIERLRGVVVFFGGGVKGSLLCVMRPAHTIAALFFR